MTTTPCALAATLVVAISYDVCISLALQYAASSFEVVAVIYATVGLEALQYIVPHATRVRLHSFKQRHCHEPSLGGQLEQL